MIERDRFILHWPHSLHANPEEAETVAPRIAAVVLAAGGSSRFGTPKQLLTHHGENLVRRAAREAIHAGLNPVIVVLGAYARSIEPFLAGLEPVSVAVNEKWESGQASSIRIGLERAASLRCDAAAVILADQPLIESSSLTELIVKFREGHRLVASRYSGILGAPALFGSEYFAQLNALSGDFGAGTWLRRNADEVTAVDMPEASVDIDTPHDMRHLPT